MCKEKKIIYNRTAQSRRIPLPDIPECEWCDFRPDYESGMTLKEVAEKYCCDPRTVKRCIFANKSSSELGKQMEPTKLATFSKQIDSLYCEITDTQEILKKKMGICDISRRITAELEAEGYTGSERTVRNYLRSHYQFVTDSDEPWEEI